MQVDPPLSAAEEQAEQTLERDEETVETRTMAANAGKWVRREFEETMLAAAAKLELQCSIAEHPHLLETQVVFTVTGPRRRIDEFAGQLNAENWSTVRARRVARRGRAIAAMLEQTRFDPAEVEPRIIERWLSSHLFHPEPLGDAVANYSIAIPPPNVTDRLHMGHALNNTIQDVLIRYQRMRGRRTKWILGTDHAGIATQAQVEKMLRAEGTSRQELGREEFLRRVWEWREHYGHTIVEQLKRLGASCDYEEERFTLDEAYARSVAEAFVALYRKGYIYRDRYIVNWDPGSHSAISDLEVEDRRETDTLYSIVYDLEGGGTATIATVRPETMLADTAVAVNPTDERYRDLVGREAVLPLVGRRLPIIADDYVKTDFGTGQLKVTPAHDPNDFEIGRRHGLEVISVIGEDGRMTDAAGERFAGMSVEEARAAVVAALEQEGRIASAESYEHDVPYSHRSGVRIEPLVSLQWFMRMDELAPPAVDAVREGRVRIIPENHERVYEEWMAGIRPWCISRQLWWGHRIPVYYCERCDAVRGGDRAA